LHADYVQQSGGHLKQAAVGVLDQEFALVQDMQAEIALQDDEQEPLADVDS
jgi:hypothetical protein